MNDVTTTPAPAPEPQSQPAPQAEVTINQNPSLGPSNAVPSQAPEKATPDRPPPSRRESIQRALAKQRQENPPQPREARKGDNNPPEETPDEKADEGFSLKKRPSDQPRERGRFAARPASDAQPGAAAGRPASNPGAPAAPQAYRPPPGAPAHHHPLPRMSPRAAADWDKVPDTVRADAHRMYREVGQAFQRYKGAHDYMRSIEPYARMAQQQGTHLAHVLQNHVNIEEKLRSDPIGGLEVIVHNLNLQTPEGRRLTFADLAWHALNQTPEQQQLIQQRNAAQATRLQLEQMRAEQQRLANEYRRMQYAQHFNATRGAVDRYADTRPRFDELGDLIHQEIKLGFDLDTAYRRAEMLRPATAAQTRNGTTAAQTRAPDRSISGSPSGVVANGAARDGKPVSRAEALKRAFSRHGSAL